MHLNSKQNENFSIFLHFFGIFNKKYQISLTSQQFKTDTDGLHTGDWRILAAEWELEGWTWVTGHSVRQSSRIVETVGMLAVQKK